MSQVLSVQLDNEGAYYSGGDVISGKVILEVEKERLSIREFKMRMICDVDSSISVNKAKTDHAPNLRTYKNNLRIFDESFIMELGKSHYDIGQHAIPFKFKVPKEGLGLPPSVTTVISPSTYGNVTYRLKAHFKKGVSSWFAGTDLKGAVQFLYMPVNSMDKSKLDTAELREEPFNELLEGGMKAEKSFMSSVFGKKPKEEPPLELKGVFQHPDIGLAQNTTVPLKLHIQPGNPNEQITVKSLSLHLETLLVVAYRDSFTYHTIKSDPLMQAQLIRSGNVIELSDLISKNRVPSTLAPSFDTPVMAFRHQVRIEILLSRKSSSAMMKFSHRIPVVVLAPFKLGNPQAFSSRPDSKLTLSHQTDQKVKPAFDVKPPSLPERQRSQSADLEPRPGPSNAVTNHPGPSDTPQIIASSSQGAEEVPSEAPPDYQEVLKH